VWTNHTSWFIGGQAKTFHAVLGIDQVSTGDVKDGIFTVKFDGVTAYTCTNIQDASAIAVDLDVTGVQIFSIDYTGTTGHSRLAVADAYFVSGYNVVGSSILLPARTTPPNNTTTNSALLWTDGTNQCAVFMHADGVRTTNKFTMSTWP